ncbi:SAM-dependent methyltransferase [Actinophytocola oryzae]|uniref:S-adenosyl methyltransferase n=1 Tax=Actinophytocola oryzae TaxID=502181 RepID=A0A4R7UQ64_9PSEU|nr:SAM-dependent methyltransferase [Actinophytocola oryzae]TDV35916.1 S-adenosyl methyltransferase [Actinophytocola oryzae]
MIERPAEIFGGIDTSVPNAARVYDYLLGGAHNFPVDRQFARRTMRMMPNAADVPRVNRSFLRRAVLFMIDNGVRQFLDIGSGIPSVGNVHEIAQEVDPACRVVYVDKEPIAVEYSRILLRGNNRAAAIYGDLRDPDDLLTRPEITHLLDFSEPVGLLTLLVWHFVSDTDDPEGLLARYHSALAPGSYLALSHMTRDGVSRWMNQTMDDALGRIADDTFTRERGRVTEMFAGFELVPPGVVECAAWRPEGPGDFSDAPDFNAVTCAGVGRVL